MKKLSYYFSSVFVLAFLLMLTPTPSQAQNKRQLLTMEMMAKSLFDNLAFDEALNEYLKLDSLKPNIPDFYYHIGICYIHTNDHTKALPYLEKCLQTPAEFPMALNYYAGRAYHLSNRFDDAIVYYQKYRDFFIEKKGKHLDRLIDDVNREIEMCNNGKEFIKNPLQIEIVNIGPIVNSIYPDYAPVISADEDELIFTSNRPNTTGGKIAHKEDGEYYEDIYISHKTDSGWSAPLQIGDSINTEDHDASIALSPDGQQLLIYRNSRENLMASTSGDLYISELKGTIWTKAIKLSDNINSKGWEPSACISENGKTLIFVSDREGGTGGTDLYISTKDNSGQWGVAVSLSKNINTTYDEDSPFIHPDGKTLYFSSKGHNSMGGFDVFVSEYNDSLKEWSLPKNAGYPISTSHDDLHFSWSADGNRIYFSTVRPDGYGDKDIYYAEIKKKESAKVALLKGRILDSTGTIAIEALIKITDTESGEEIGVFKSNSETGHYSIVLVEGKKYSIEIEAELHVPIKTEFNVENVNEFEKVDKDYHLQIVKFLAPQFIFEEQTK